MSRYIQDNGHAALIAQHDDDCENLKNSCFLWVILLVIGLSTYLMGCHPMIGGNCASYIVKDVTIIKNNCATNNEYCLKGIYYVDNLKLTCNIENTIMCPTSQNQCRIKYNKIYPLNSTTSMYIGKTDSFCRSPSKVKTLAIVGIIFLLLCGLAIFYYFILLFNYSKKYSEQINNSVLNPNTPFFGTQPQITNLSEIQPQNIILSEIQPQNKFNNINSNIITDFKDDNEIL